MTINELVCEAPATTNERDIKAPANQRSRSAPANQHGSTKGKRKERIERQKETQNSRPTSMTSYAFERGIWMVIG